MPVRVHVNGYSDRNPNERPRGFELGGVYIPIYAVEAQWHSHAARFFRVRADGRTYLLRYDERRDEWTLRVCPSRITPKSLHSSLYKSG
jgi:hypothetical protein